MANVSFKGKPTLIKSRQIAERLGLEMKISDVEYQGDGTKAIFYYIADGRVDFRELIKHYAHEFGIKIEMRQIGARQEAAMVGGIGSCGKNYAALHGEQTLPLSRHMQPKYNSSPTMLKNLPVNAVN
jgi:cell fate regulator YaaT (PSP1 superfamily)